MPMKNTKAAFIPDKIKMHTLCDLMLDIPEPANVKRIGSEFALMVSDRKRGVTFLGILS